MMSSAFTKGPWKTFLGESQVGDANAEGICAMWRINRDASDEDNAEGRANARLIAAAPEMFEALKAVDEHIQYLERQRKEPLPSRLMNKIHIALLKAASLEPYGLKPGEKK